VLANDGTQGGVDKMRSRPINEKEEFQTLEVEMQKYR